MKHFYEKNTELIDSDVNVTFEEVLWMTEDEFRSWLSNLRTLVCDIWDKKGTPPVVGINESDIIEQFSKMPPFPVHKFLLKDELTGEENIIRNTSYIGNAVNCWFPTMMKTAITYTTKDKARSIYDYFADDGLFETQLTYSRRHFKRDSFYHYSAPVKVNDPSVLGKNTNARTGVEWIKMFESTFRAGGEYDYWLEPRDEDNTYTGYNEDLKDGSYLFISKTEIDELDELIPDKCKTNINYRSDKYDSCRIRLFKYGQKLFPVGFKAFRISYCQYAVNFPPLTAKFLYERYTEEFKDRDIINIWDPSSGWGGRLLGALSVSDDRNIHYIGTDPNKDHTLEDGTTKYDNFATFFNSKIDQATCLFPHENSWEIHQCGSEVFCEKEAFDNYVGKVSVVFTSPPYFAKEVYSDDPEQSCHKFTEYDAWRDGFLRPTLENAYKLLHKDGYLIWNIADAQFGRDMLPLEEDSCRIMEELGLEYVETMKMALAQMPGGNRIDDETGAPTAKNFCKIKNKKKELFLKYEPVFVYRKVEDD
jgi:hypothetical protein